MSDDNSTIVEKVATLKSAIHDLKDVLSSNGLIAESAPLSDYALSINNNIESISYKERPETLVWIKNDPNPKRLNLIGQVNYGDIPQNARKIVFGTNVTSIGLSALSNYVDLAEITFSSTLTSVNNLVFKDNIGLTDVYIPDTVLSVGYSVFSGCSNLSSIYIGSGLKRISNNFFMSCSKLSKVEFSSNSNLSSLGNMVFQNCYKLSSVILPNSIEEIGIQAFQNCSALKNINIPENITCIMDSTFENCSNLNVITLPKQLQKIKNRAFYNCTNLEYIITQDLPDDSIHINEISANTFTNIKANARVIAHGSHYGVNGKQFSANTVSTVRVTDMSIVYNAATII